MAPIRPLLIFFSPDRQPQGCLDDQGRQRQCQDCRGCAFKESPERWPAPKNKKPA